MATLWCLQQQAYHPRGSMGSCSLGARWKLLMHEYHFSLPILATFQFKLSPIIQQLPTRKTASEHTLPLRHVKPATASTAARAESWRSLARLEARGQNVYHPSHPKSMANYAVFLNPYQIWAVRSRQTSHARSLCDSQNMRACSLSPLESSRLGYIHRRLSALGVI